MPDISAIYYYFVHANLSNGRHSKFPVKGKEAYNTDDSKFYSIMKGKGTNITVKRVYPCTKQSLVLHGVQQE